MALTELPTKTDASIGRAKSDQRPPGAPAVDLDHQVPAAEFERIKDLLIALAEEVGLTDGSTAGSLREAVAATPARIRQALDAEVVGTTYVNVGAVYLPAGTLQAASRVFLGVTTAAQDDATVELRRETGGALITSWTVAGPLASQSLAAPAVIPADDWYNIRLAAGGALVVAKLKGIDWTVVT